MNLVDSLFYMDNSMLGMGDSYSEYVSELYQVAFGDIKDFNDLESDELDNLHKEALKTLSKDADFLKNSLDCYSEYDNEYFADMSALCGQTNELLNALVTLEKYSLVVLEKNYDLFKLIPFLKEHGSFIEKCSQIGYHYWTYLDSNLWGTQSNSAGTIGEVILDGEYQFVLHPCINKIDLHTQYDVYLEEDITGMKVVVKVGDEVIKDFYPTGVTSSEIGREIGHNLNSILDKHNKNH